MFLLESVPFLSNLCYLPIGELVQPPIRDSMLDLKLPNPVSALQLDLNGPHGIGCVARNYAHVKLIPVNLPAVFIPHTRTYVSRNGSLGSHISASNDLDVNRITS